MNRRQIIKTAAAGLFGLLTAAAYAQNAAQPMRMVVPFPPGGGTDVLGREIAAKLETVLKRPVIVDNRPGAGGIIGTDVVAQSPKDGNTLLFAGLVPSPRFYNQPTRIADVAPVCAIARSPYVIAVHPSVPAKTIA